MLAATQLKQAYQLNVPIASSFTQAEQLPFKASFCNDYRIKRTWTKWF